MTISANSNNKNLNLIIRRIEILIDSLKLRYDKF